jgi:hypothetical protein
MAELKATTRAKIPKKEFAVPGKAKTAGAKKESGNYPIENKAHARNALSRVSQHGTPAEKKQVRAAVKRKYPDIGADKKKK